MSMEIFMPWRCWQAAAKSHYEGHTTLSLPGFVSPDRTIISRPCETAHEITSDVLAEIYWFSCQDIQLPSFLQGMQRKQKITPMSPLKDIKRLSGEEVAVSRHLSELLQIFQDPRCRLHPGWSNAEVVIMVQRQISNIYSTSFSIWIVIIWNHIISPVLPKSQYFQAESVRHYEQIL